MNIGIVTPYDSANYGAFLQAYASMIYLQSLGHNVSFIKWRTDKERKAEFFIKPKTLKLRLHYLLRYPFTLKRFKVFNDVLSHFQILDYNNLEKSDLDAVVIGSDEVFNINSERFQKELFYGVGYPDKVKIFAYAPSARDASAEDFKKFPIQAGGLNNVNIIGVRDENTAAIINDLTGKTSPVVCDPTMLLKLEDYKFTDEKLIKEKYLLVYAYSLPRNHREYLVKYAKENGLKLVSVCMHHFWCDKNICCTPFGFSSLIKNAECVYTTTFHGSIFTLLNHKTCIISAPSKKLQDLISWTGMATVCVDDSVSYEQFIALLKKQPDYAEFEARASERRTFSRELYKHALDKEE